jgi:hypothetical protein
MASYKSRQRCYVDLSLLSQFPVYLEIAVPINGGFFFTLSNHFVYELKIFTLRSAPAQNMPGI